jgi:hypothetical protein
MIEQVINIFEKNINFNHFNNQTGEIKRISEFMCESINYVKNLKKNTF